MNAEIEKKIGKNIRVLRERADLTQEQVAAKLQTNGCDIITSRVAHVRSDCVRLSLTFCKTKAVRTLA